jgi:hypothetical protein
VSRLTRFKLLTAAINVGAYGIDAIQAGTPVAILTSNMEITPIEGDTLDRPLDDGLLGNKSVAMVGTHVKISGYVEMAGAGTDTDIPAYQPIMVAAGFEATVGASFVEFERPAPGTERDVTFYVYLDGVVHKVTGARATFSTTINVGELPRREFEITGLYAGHAANATLPVADFTQFQKPVKVGAINTTLTVGGVERKMLEFELTENVEINYDENTVDEAVYLTDYAVEGRMLIEAPDVSVFDPISIALAETQLEIELIHGVTVGRIEQINIPKVQLGRPTYNDRNGRMAWDIPFTVIGTYKLTTK